VVWISEYDLQQLRDRSAIDSGHTKMGSRGEPTASPNHWSQGKRRREYVSTIDAEAWQVSSCGHRSRVRKVSTD